MGDRGQRSRRCAGWPSLAPLAEGGHPETNPFLHHHAKAPSRRQPAGRIIKIWQLVLFSKNTINQAGSEGHQSQRGEATEHRRGRQKVVCDVW